MKIKILAKDLRPDMLGKSVDVEYNMKKFSGKLYFSEESLSYFVLHNNENFKGTTPTEGTGKFKYSWQLTTANYSSFVLTVDKVYIEKLSIDFEEGDVLKVYNSSSKDLKDLIVLEKIGECVLYSDKNPFARSKVEYARIDYLYGLGYRVEGITEEEKTELSMDEIAKKFNIPVDKLKIKKE